MSSSFKRTIIAYRYRIKIVTLLKFRKSLFSKNSEVRSSKCLPFLLHVPLPKLKMSSFAILFYTIFVSTRYRVASYLSADEQCSVTKNFVKSIAAKRMIRVSGKARDRRTMESNNKCLIVA